MQFRFSDKKVFLYVWVNVEHGRLGLGKKDRWRSLATDLSGS